MYSFALFPASPHRIHFHISCFGMFLHVGGKVLVSSVFAKLLIQDTVCGLLLFLSGTISNLSTESQISNAEDSGINIGGRPSVATVDMNRPEYKYWQSYPSYTEAKNVYRKEARWDLYQ